MRGGRCPSICSQQRRPRNQPMRQSAASALSQGAFVLRAPVAKLSVKSFRDSPPEPATILRPAGLCRGARVRFRQSAQSLCLDRNRCAGTLLLKEHDTPRIALAPTASERLGHFLER
jgi:hypothetical protein